ncbi:putative claudin-24 [Pleurodeles waltl]
MSLINKTGLQGCGIFLPLFGWVLSCTATWVPLWKNLNLDLNEMEIWNMGLWQVCIFQEEGPMECKDYTSFLALPPELRISRILMTMSNGLGLLGLIFATCGLDCLKCGGKGTKKRLLLLAAVMFYGAGITTLVPVSWVAYIAVKEFWDEDTPELVPRWEFGEALFMGWFGGFFLILGGMLLMCSACCTRSQPQLVYYTPTQQRAQYSHVEPKNPDLRI